MGMRGVLVPLSLISQKRREDARTQAGRLCALQKLARNGMRRLTCGRKMGYQAKP